MKKKKKEFIVGFDHIHGGTWLNRLCEAVTSMSGVGLMLAAQQVKGEI